MGGTSDVSFLEPEDFEQKQTAGGGGQDKGKAQCGLVEHQDREQRHGVAQLWGTACPTLQALHREEERAVRSWAINSFPYLSHQELDSAAGSAGLAHVTAGARIGLHTGVQPSTTGSLNPRVTFPEQGDLKFKI